MAALHRHVWVEEDELEASLSSTQNASKIEDFTAVQRLLALTREVGTASHQHRGSGHGAPPGPTPTCPSVGLGGSSRVPPYLVWGYILETAALETKEVNTQQVAEASPPVCHDFHNKHTNTHTKRVVKDSTDLR